MAGDRGAKPLTIDVGLRCVSCGYSLLGLAASGRCPECNSPVGQSLQSRLLRNADRRWLRRVVVGVDLCLLSIIAGALLYLASQLVLMLSPTAAALQAPNLLRALGEIAGPLLALIGVFLLTTPEPSRADARRIMRMVARVAAAAVVCSRAIMLSGVAPGATGFFQLVELVGLVVVMFCVFSYFAALSHRARLVQITAQLQFLKWAIALTVLLPLLSVVISVYFRAFASLHTGIAGLVISGGLLFLLVLAGWALVLLIVFRIKLGSHLESVCRRVA